MNDNYTNKNYENSMNDKNKINDNNNQYFVDVDGYWIQMNTVGILLHSVT